MQKPLTEDAIHNWGEKYIAAQYPDLLPEIRAAVVVAMRRHHQQGTDARTEAAQINAHFHLLRPERHDHD